MNDYGRNRGTDIVSQIRWALNRITHMVRWNKISKEPDESDVVSKVQITTFEDQEVQDNVTYMEHYGFHAVPDVKCDTVTLNLAGNNHHATIIASNDQRYKPTDMKVGESGLYDNNKQRILLRGGNKLIEQIGDTVTTNCKTLVVNADVEIVFRTPKLTVIGKLDVLGDIFGGANILADKDVISGGFYGVSLNTHSHLDFDTTPPHPTSEPIGVASTLSSTYAIVNPPFQARVTDTDDSVPKGDKI